jgi:hypothetical protein
MEKVICDACGGECTLPLRQRLISIVNSSVKIPPDPFITSTIVRDFCNYSCLLSFVNNLLKSHDKLIHGRDYEELLISTAIDGNTVVWCRNGFYAPEATPCQSVSCPYKNNVKRLGTPHELRTCSTYHITEPSSDWATAKHVFPPPRR